MADEDEGTAPSTAAVSQYETSSQLRRPRQFFGQAWRSLLASLPLSWGLFTRDLRARYRLSVLGFGWIILPAIAQTAIWLFLNKANIINSGETNIPLPLYVLLGTLLWQGFVDALFAPGNQLSAAGSMLSRVSFPPESILLAGLADAAVNMLARMTIAIPVFLYYGVVPGWGLVLAPIGVIALLLLGFAIGLAIAPFGLLYQDLSRLLTITTGFWLLVTPVAYNVPDVGAGRWITRLNPVSPLLLSTRAWLSGGSLFPGWSMPAILGLTLVLLLIGWVIFRLSIPHLIDRIGT